MEDSGPLAWGGWAGGGVRRIKIGERKDWREIAEREGFTFHYMDGELYWAESACDAFTLEEVECGLEAPTEELHAMCLDLVAEAVTSDALMARLAIPEEQRTLIAATRRMKSPPRSR